MKIGIVSDSHGNTRRLRAALDLLTDQDVEAIVHCGDHGSIEAVETLGELEIPVYAVAGNVDRDLDELARAAQQAGLHYDPRAIEIPLGETAMLAATHGHLESLVEDFVRGGRFAFVCHGHTHKQRNDLLGQTRVICPGSLHKPKGPKTPSCAVLDSHTGDIAFLEVMT
jgi:uncharacterized protein